MKIDRVILRKVLEEIYFLNTHSLSQRSICYDVRERLAELNAYMRATPRRSQRNQSPRREFNPQQNDLREEENKSENNHNISMGNNMSH
jgi:hypothetical protein